MTVFWVILIFACAIFAMGQDSYPQIDLSIPVPTCKHCGGAGVISNVESLGARKEFVHDRDPRVWSAGAATDDRRRCVPTTVLLRLSPAEQLRAKKYTFELLDNATIARGVLDEGANEIATWRAKSWETK